MKACKVILLLMPFLLFNCKKQDDIGVFQFNRNETFLLYHDYKSDNRDVEFAISEFNDSRCPIGAMCVWQGEAKIVLSFTHPLRETIELSTYDNLKDTLQNISVELVDVSPHPEITKSYTHKNYRVVLQFSEL
jgi:hypothetical protein